jgi:hypothetical protein
MELVFDGFQTLLLIDRDKKMQLDRFALPQGKSRFLSVN